MRVVVLSFRLPILKWPLINFPFDPHSQFLMNFSVFLAFVGHTKTVLTSRQTECRQIMSLFRLVRFEECLELGGWRFYI